MTDSWSMKVKIFAITFASLLSVVVNPQAAPNQAPDRTWITDVNVISPEKLDHIEKGNVLIENGRIVRVERGKGARKPAGQRWFREKGSF